MNKENLSVAQIMSSNIRRLFFVRIVLVILICAISGFILLECKIRIANHHYSEKVDAVVIRR